MEDLKQYRVDFKVTYHCIGRKGLFRKKEYSFDFVMQLDELRAVYSYINARTASSAVKKARARAEKHANYLVEQVKKLSDGEYLTITGNTAPDGKFQWSANVYDITGVDIELVKVRQLRVWKDENIKYAMERLSVTEFKSVFNEIPQQ